LGKGGEFRKCKGVSRRVWRKIRSRSKKTGGNRREMESKVESKSKQV